MEAPPQQLEVKLRIPWQNAADVDWAEDLPEVADKPWWFFHLPKVQDRLRQLPWSFQDCCARITPKGKGVGIKSDGFPNLFSSHGIIQLALWKTPVFDRAPEGYVYAPAASTSKDRKLHICPQRSQLFDALADAFLWYEYRCRYLYDMMGYEMACIKMERAIGTLNTLPTILEQLRKRGYTPEDSGLKYQHSNICKQLEYLKKMASLLTKNDYRHAGGPSQCHADPRQTDIKKRLVWDMRDAFRSYGPVPFRSMVTYRSIVEMN